MWLHCCSITRLPDSIGGLSNLEKLRIKDTEIRSLPNDNNMSNLMSLKELKLEDQIFFHPRLQPSVLDVIKNIPNLEHLSLSASSSNIINSMPILPQLKKLCVELTRISIPNDDGGGGNDDDDDGGNNDNDGGHQNDNNKLFSLDMFDRNDWNNDATLQHLEIYIPSRNFVSGAIQLLEGADYRNIFIGLPKSLRTLKLHNCKIEGLLDDLTNDIIPVHAKNEECGESIV